MNKRELYEFFNQQISMTAISYRGEESVVKGKYCFVAVEGNLIDIWICNPENISEGLSQRLSNTKLRALKHRGMKEYRELDGEGFIRTYEKNVVLQNLKLLGIRKKATFSKEHLAKAKLNLKRSHK